MTTSDPDLSSELEVLHSIYVDELLVEEREDGSCELSLILFPSTAEDSVSQFVCLTLSLEVDSQYPSSAPIISIRNPRGLSDDKLSSMQACLQSEAQSCLGSPVLYQLIEKAKEILTESNIPHGNCVICLYGFKEGEAFTKTCCYHYFHSHCLGRYVRHSESEILLREKELQEDKTRASAQAQELCVVCPVCREALTYDVDRLLSCPAPKLPEVGEAAMSSDFQQRWRELQKVLEKQRSKGGIIDPEEESNRFLIHINEPQPENGNQDSDYPLHPQTSSAAFPVFAESKPQTLSPSAHQRVSGPRKRWPGSDRSNMVSEQLDKLSLGSSGTERCRQHKTQGRSEAQPMSKTGPEFASLTDDASGGRGHPDRRRRGGHQRRPGPPRYHWHSRAPRGPGRGVRQREEVL